MKITVTPPPQPPRKFTLELSELELQSIKIAMGITSHYYRKERARTENVEILDGDTYYELLKELDRTLKN